MSTAPDNPSPLPFIHPDDMPDVYCLTGVGTCMEPLYNDGALLAFDKRTRPGTGDVVGIIFTREAARRRAQPGSIKRLVLGLPPSCFDGSIVAEQLNPPRQYIFDTRDVLAVHKCIGTAEPGEDGIARIAADLVRHADAGEGNASVGDRRN
jgi:hypothetical protein